MDTVTPSNASTNPADTPGDADAAPQSFFAQDRFTLTLGSILALLLSIWLLSMMHLPAVPHRAGSILQQNNGVMAMAVIWIAVFISAAAASVVAARNHFDGGLFCACIGLAGIASRFGGVRFALFSANGPSIYLSFAIELILLAIPLVLVWIMLHRLSRAGIFASEKLIDGDVEEPLDQKIIATAAQTLATIIIMLLLCQSDAKKQTLASVAAASYFGALIAYQFVATRPSAWFWVGPLLAGLIGYIGQYFMGTDWVIGEARGFFAPLARPLPLDYASLGVAGAMLGYWTAQSSHQARLELDQSV